MPVYTVYHRSIIEVAAKAEIASGLTSLHSTVTAAQRKSVKVFFIALGRDSYFSGGEPAEEYVRVVAQIRQGRSQDQRMRLMRGMYELVHSVVGSSDGAVEIQTQILEIDDTKTVLTNGVLND